jgi:RND family efflux transporter MFP subunit
VIVRPAVLVLLALAACHRDAVEEPFDAGALPVLAAHVVRGDIDENAEATGTLEALPGRDVKLGALVPGILAQLDVAEGDQVKKGQILARVDQTAVKDAVSQAEAQLAQAKAQEAANATKLERAQRAFQAGVAAGQEVDDARTQEAASKSAVQAAQAALSTSQNQVARSELRAPFDGTVAHVFAAPGEPVEGSGKPIVEFADTRVLELHARFAPAQATRLKAGDGAQLWIEGTPGSPRTASVVAIAPTVDANTGTVTARVHVENPDGALKAGASGRARVVLAQHRGVLLVPRSALVPLEQEGTASGARKLAVERVAPDGAVTRVPVEVGATDDARSEVSGELNPGDVVVTQGAYALPDGTRVQVRFESEDGGR